MTTKKKLAKKTPKKRTTKKKLAMKSKTPVMIDSGRARVDVLAREVESVLKQL